MNSNLPKFAMVMTSDDADVKRANRELRQDLAETGKQAANTAPAFEAQAEAVDKATVAQQRLSQATETAATVAKQSIASIGVAADQIKPSMDRLVNSFAGITAPAANRNGRAADILAYGQELDRLQAKFDPLFAAQNRYQTKLEEINHAERVGALSASAAIDARLRETNAINALVNNLDRLAIARKRAAEGAVGALTITPDREADIAAYGAQLDGLRAKYNPVFATLTQYKAQLADIREAHRVGAISADEMTAAISRQRQATLATVAAFKGREPSGAAGGSMDRFRLQNLGYQAFDVGQGLFGGMPLPLIAAQQGPQIAQMYAGQGGTGAFMKDLGTIASGAAKAITPVTVGITGLTAAIVAGAVAYNSYLKSTKEVETAASGLGRAVAGTSAEMEAAAQAGAAAAGISVASARSMEAQFLRTGRIGSENFEQLLSLSKDFGATIGMDADEAGAALAEMFSDPARAAQTLYQQYGLIDAATARQATNLARQNRQSEAQAVLLNALPAQLASAEEATTALGRAWDFTARMASNATNAIGGAIDRALSGPTQEERLAEIRRLQGQAGENSFTGFFARGRGAALEEEAAELNEQIRRRNQADFERQRRAAAIAQSRAAVSTAEGSGANANFLRERELRNEIDAIRNGRSGLEGDEARMADAAIEAKTRALDALINRQQRATELDRLDIQIQNERNPLLRAELEARRERLQLSGQENQAGEAEAAAARARNRVIEETIGGAQRQAQDMRDELEVRTRLNSMVASGAITSEDANRMLQEELTLRPLIVAAAIAEGEAKDRLNKTIEDLRAGYQGLAAQQKQAAAQEYLKSGNERLEQLRVEQVLIGANEGVRERALAQLEAEQQIRRRGLDTNGDLARQIRAQADEMAQLNRQVDRQAEAWSKVKSTAEDAIDGMVDKLSEGDFGGALDELKDALLGFAKDDIKANLKNALLGTDNGTSADIGGFTGIMSRLFGGNKGDPASVVKSAMGQTVGAMSVNAGTVMINGGLAGGATGLLGAAANNNTPGGFSGLAGAGSVQTTGTAVDMAAGLLGLNENTNNRDINAFLKKGGVDIDAAQTKWCAGFVNSALSQIGVKGSGSLTANSFLNWGQGVDINQVLKGDVLVQSRGLGANVAGGHVGFATGASRIFDGRQQLEMLSGNSADSVAKTWINASELTARRATEAASALGSMASSTNVAAQGLGNLGTGFDTFGKSLTSMFPAAPSAPSAGGGGGGLFGWLGNLFGGTTLNSALSASPQFASAWAAGGIGLYDVGGPTGGNDPKRVAGLVHEKEFVFDAQATEAIGVGNLEALRRTARRGAKSGYDTGGYVSSIAYPVANNNFATSTSAPARNAPIINNYAGAEVSYEEQTDERGNKQPIITLGEPVAAAIRQRGNPARRAMQSEFGLQPRKVAR